MNIYCIGTDIVNINRIKNAFKKNSNSFKKRIYTNFEIKRCERRKNKIECFAKRFAAKEAFSKALGTGISKGISFNEIIVLNEKSGKPYIKLINKTKKIVERKLKKKVYKISLSIADEKDYAVAFVTISI